MQERFKAIMTLHAYFDGSGKENDHPVVTVGGYLADDLACRAIEADWIAATKKKRFT
jgi:hypothetical protein